MSDLEIIGGFNLGFHLFEIARAGIGEAVVTEGALIRDYPDLKAIPLSPEVKTLNCACLEEKYSTDSSYKSIY